MKNPPIRLKKISIRITLSFSFLLVFIAMVITFLNITLYSREVSDQMDIVVTQKLSLITGRLDENIRDIRQIHTILINDKNVLEAFRETVENPSDNNVDNLSSILESRRLNTPGVKNIIAIGMEGEIYDPIKDFPAYQQLTNNNEEFRIATDQQQYQRLTLPNTFPLEYSKPTMTQRNNITLYAQYFDYSPITQLGYLAINFSKNTLFTEIDTLVEDSFSGFYIVDEYGQLVHEIGDLPFDGLPDNLMSLSNLELNKHVYDVRSSSLSSYERWHFISLFDRENITLQTDRLNRYIYLTLLVALLLMLLLSWVISQNITNPIRKMIVSMKEFERGQWPEPLTTNNQDEIKDLIEGYNNMLTSTIKLTDDIIGRQLENQIIEVDLVKTQLHLLEAQINPHFIHNTLNSMNYLALVKGNKELSTLIESFNKLLRMSMAIDVSYVTVAQEVENIKDYAHIQNIRFEDAFIIDTIIDPSALMGKIPKLILQPIVENAIIHGILPSGRQGHILIAIRKKANMLMITITDDGIGIPQERLEAILNRDKKGSLAKHIGVQNVFDRLQLYYGSGIDVTMKSTPGNGTTTIIMIPYED